MKRFNSSTVRASTHLVETPLKSKAHDKRVYKQALEWADGKKVVRVREYLAPVKPDFAPRGFGRKVKGLSHEKRMLVLERAEKRKAFFAELGVRV